MHQSLIQASEKSTVFTINKKQINLFTVREYLLDCAKKNEYLIETFSCSIKHNFLVCKRYLP